MMLNTDKAWKKWGRDDPYYAVLTDERFSGAKIGQNRDVFFESGREYIDALLKKYEHHFGLLPRTRALDHGCGTGRLTLPLAAQFTEVVAVDVAPAMLAEARKNTTAAGAVNIRYDQADDDLSKASGTFDFVNSHLVLQHVPVRRGLRIIGALIGCVAPGGGVHLSVSVRIDRGVLRWLYWASANIPGVKIWQNICAGRDWNAAAMQMNDYPLGSLFSRFAASGITEVATSFVVEPRFLTCSIIGCRAFGPERSTPTGGSQISELLERKKPATHPPIHAFK